MEFLDSLVLPVSSEHLSLLNLLLIIATLMFNIYTGILLGTVYLSTLFKRRGEMSGDLNKTRFSRDIIDIMTAKPTTWFGFGLMPLLACMFIYIQLGYQTGSTTPQILIVTSLVYALALIVTYFYRHSIMFSDLFDVYSESRNKKEDFRSENASNYFTSMVNITKSAAFWSLALLLITAWMFNTGIHISKNPETWAKSALVNMFTFGPALKTLSFIASSIAIAGATFVYLRFYWDGGYKYDNIEYADKSKSYASGAALIGLIFQPILYGFGMIFNESEALSLISFGSAATAVVLAFIASHYLYSIVKMNEAKFIKFGYLFLLASFTFFVLSDQFGYQESNKKNMAKLAHRFEEIELARLAESAAPIVYDGATIFKQRCSACHKFDEKQATAPAYTDVIPKYEGKVDEMIAFILNPKPRNPAEYPSGMANPGLNKGEAEAIANWLLVEIKNYQ